MNAGALFVLIELLKDVEEAGGLIGPPAPEVVQTGEINQVAALVNMLLKILLVIGLVLEYLADVNGNYDCFFDAILCCLDHILCTFKQVYCTIVKG